MVAYQRDVRVERLFENAPFSPDDEQARIELERLEAEEDANGN